MKQSKLNPYIGFKDQAKQAMEFYKTVFGGKLTLTTFGESHASEDPAEKDKIMHAILEAENGMTLMASDMPNSMTCVTWQAGSSISVSLSGDNEVELKGYWDKLAEGASVKMPLEKAAWGDMFGMLTDRFGINWMVNIAGKK
jgi:PhnB protein